MTKFVLELHCEAPDGWAPDDRAMVLARIAEDSNHVLTGIGAAVRTWGLRGAPAQPKGPYPLEESLAFVPIERREILRALVEAARESPFDWRHYPHSPTDYLTDLWGLLEKLPPLGLGARGAVRSAFDLLDREFGHADARHEPAVLEALAALRSVLPESITDEAVTAHTAARLGGGCR